MTQTTDRRSDYPCCAPERVAAPKRLTSLDVICLQIIAGLVLGLVACEIAALLGFGPHVTVIFGGRG